VHLRRNASSEKELDGRRTLDLPRFTFHEPGDATGLVDFSLLFLSRLRGRRDSRGERRPVDAGSTMDETIGMQYIAC
jgi:hypothetical protein